MDDAARRVVGYAGLWLMVDEAHVTSIAVSPPFRGFGVGELLFLALVDMSREIGAHYMTLEVRVSNTLAQNLYRKFGFKEAGIRRRYYSDNNEDALIMWSDPLESPGFQQMVEEHRQALIARLGSRRLWSQLRERGVRA
jgi:ribosomal-protein-alanine N-acetyltransferase